MYLPTAEPSTEPLALVEDEKGDTHVKNLRIGTRALTFWPQRFTTDDDAQELHTLLREVSASSAEAAEARKGRVGENARPTAPVCSENAKRCSTFTSSFLCRCGACLTLCR